MYSVTRKRQPRGAVLAPWAVLAVWAVSVAGVEAQGGEDFWWLTTSAAPLVQCECVRYFLCVDGVISTSGHGTLDARMSGGRTSVEQCPDPLDVCCLVPPSSTTTTTIITTTTTTPPPTTTTLAITTPQEPMCKCVKFFLCVDGVISTSGEGIIDIRMAGGATTPPPVFNVVQCPDDFDVCCGLPPSTTTTEAPATTTTLRPTLPPDTPCECVPFLECTAERLVSDGLGNTTLELLGIGYSHTKCPQSFSVCCASDPPSPTTTTARPPIVQPHSTVLCVCVEPYLCGPDGHIITTGEGIFDIRTLPSSTGRCDDQALVCCRPPIDETPTTTTTPLPTTTTPLPTTTQEPVVACGTRNTDGLTARILGFRNGESQFGEFPWVAAILNVENLMGLSVRRFAGGGTLIHPRVILTAAHKVFKSNVDQLVVRLGEWDTQTENEPYPHQEFQVEEIILHPGFQRHTLFYDVALLFLKEEVHVTSHINHICMAEDITMVDPTNCVISGWGVNGFEDGEFQKIMKSLMLPLVKQRECQNSLRKTRLGRYFHLHKSFVCAGGEKGKDACKGDGGGPLACARLDNPTRYLLVGITAWGIGCGDDGVPGVYVNVPFHYNWISNIIDLRYPNTTTTEIPTTTPQYFEHLRETRDDNYIDNEFSDYEDGLDGQQNKTEERKQGRAQRREERKQQRRERRRRRKERNQLRQEERGKRRQSGRL